MIEWDASQHPDCYNLWLRGILSDGGEGCRKMCEMSGEELIPGMLVGAEKDILSTSELHQVRRHARTHARTREPRDKTKADPPGSSSSRDATETQSTSSDGMTPASML